jgi:hypothetical protein
VRDFLKFIADMIHTYGSANVFMVAVMVAFMVIIMLPALRSSAKTRSAVDVELLKLNTSQADMADKIESLDKTVGKARMEHAEQLAILDQIQQRYAQSFSAESCARIAQEVLLGTRAVLEAKIIKTIVHNDIEKNWDRIEVKIREFCRTQWDEDMSVLEEFRVMDGNPLSSYIDGKYSTMATDFALLSIRGKYPIDEVSDGLNNIYREAIAGITTKLKREG